MPKTVLHLLHADPASIQTVPALAERIRSTPDAALEDYVFGPAERMLADPDQTAFKAQIDALVTSGVQVTTCIGIAQQIDGRTVRQRSEFLRRARLCLAAVLDQRRTNGGDGRIRIDRHAAA